MTTDTRPEGAEASPPGRFPQALLETLRTGSADGSALMNLFARTSLSAEQQAFIEVLMSLEESEPDGEKVPGSSSAERSGPDEPELAEELRDLREVNDTLARALGACQYCWGGESTCPECNGMGSSGYESPDLELYHELVAPAVRRVRAMQRAGANVGHQGGRRRPGGGMR